MLTAKERVKHVHDIREALEQRYQYIAKTQAKYYDAKHKPQTYNVGDLVMLSTKNLCLKRPSRKMSHKFIGPFRVKNLVGTQAYRLTLPSTYQIHDVFHVSYLEPYNCRQGDNSTPILQPLELIDDEEEYLFRYLQEQKARHSWACWYARKKLFTRTIKAKKARPAIYQILPPNSTKVLTPTSYLPHS